MAFVGPWEIALVLVVVLILFGPKKLPELARSVGNAIREYKKAQEGITQELSVKPGEENKSEKGNEALIETAHKLGIKTEGKTTEEISQEILKKAQPSTT